MCVLVGKIHLNPKCLCAMRNPGRNFIIRLFQRLFIRLTENPEYRYGGRFTHFRPKEENKNHLYL